MVSIPIFQKSRVPSIYPNPHYVKLVIEVLGELLVNRAHNGPWSVLNSTASATSSISTFDEKMIKIPSWNASIASLSLTLNRSICMEKVNQALEKIKSNHAFEKVKMLVGMESEDEESAPVAETSYMDDFNRQCTLTTKQVLFFRYYSFSSFATLLTYTTTSSSSRACWIHY